MMLQKNAWWCPTIYIYHRGRANADVTAFRAKNFRTAVPKGVKIIFGTDIGGYPWTETENKEVSLMVNWGMTPMQAIQSATIRGAEASTSKTASEASRPVNTPMSSRYRETRPPTSRNWSGSVRDEGRDGLQAAVGVVSAFACQCRR